MKKHLFIIIKSWQYSDLTILAWALFHKVSDFIITIIVFRCLCVKGEILVFKYLFLCFYELYDVEMPLMPINVARLFFPETCCCFRIW